MTPDTNAVERVGWVLVHFVWQGAAIAAALWLVLTLVRPARATVRYALGCGALALMLLSPLVTATLVVPTTTRSPLTAAGGGAGPDAVHAASAPSASGTSDASRHADGFARGGAREDRAGAGQPVPGRERDRGATTSRDAVVGGARADEAMSPGAGSSHGTLVGETRGGGANGAGASTDAMRAALARWTLAPEVRARVAAALPWLVAVWAVGVLLLSARLAGGWWRTHALRTRDVAAVPSACQQAAARLLARMRITRPVELLTSARVRVPMVFGHVKPVVLVPAAVLAGLSPSQLEAILAHELAHVRRHDYLVNLLQTVVETVLFYHPAVWWVSRRVRIAREECCDDIAVAACGDRKGYVEALLDLEQLRDAASPALALGATDGSLLSRARRLLTDVEREGTSPRLAASVIAMAVAALAIAGISTAATESAGNESAATEPAIVKPAIEPTSDSTTPREVASGQSQPPQAVKAAPDPASSLGTRRAWAEREARTERASRYWIGYAIRPAKGLPRFVYMDRRSMILGDRVQFSGHVFSQHVENLRFGGRPLAIADADPTALKVLFAFNVNGGSSRLTDVHVSTFPLPVAVNDRPVYWLGNADTKPSLELIDGLFAQAATLDLKKDLVSAVAVHDDSPTVAAWLDRQVRAEEPDEVRAEAVEGIAWHPIPAALAAIDRAARQDRASRVRQEAAEAMGDLAMPEAAEALIALAKSLDDIAARREAVEALGARSEPAALDALGAIARQDPNVDIQVEAVETLGDLTDRRGVPLLKELARTHPQSDVRREAVETIGDAQPGADEVAFLKLIARDDTNADVQTEAVETLGDIDRPDAQTAVKELFKSHAEARVRREAVDAMVDHAPAAETVTILRDIIKRETDAHIRQDAVERLADIDDAAARTLLIEVARTDASDDLRADAVASLGNVRSASGSEIAALLKQVAFSDRSEHVRHHAIDTLDELRDGVGVDALIEIAREHPDQNTRKLALEVLVNSKHPRARQVFERALQKPSGR